MESCVNSQVEPQHEKASKQTQKSKYSIFMASDPKIHELGGMVFETKSLNYCILGSVCRDDSVAPTTVIV